MRALGTRVTNAAGQASHLGIASLIHITYLPSLTIITARSTAAFQTVLLSFFLGGKSSVGRKNEQR